MGTLRLFSGFPIVLVLLVLARDASAQAPSAPAHVSAVEGAATIERENGSEPVAVGFPFVDGDRITTAAGRVEVLFPDGSALAIDEYSAIDLQSDALLRLVDGRVMLTVVGTADPSRARRFQVDTPVATVTNAGPGEFRITLITGRTELEAELAVLRGSASLTTENGSLVLRAGERSLAADRTAPTFPETFNSARLDDFDRWAAARRRERMGPALSSQYLPSDLRMYSTTFDRYGAWNYEPTYGYVWYPVVTAGWRPYHHGYWRSVPHHGWTWIGLDFWGWPTHHYGRWGFARSRWFWVPDRRWGPAWVSWASAPGYVSWCPLGYDNRPVFALNLTFGDPWRGWAVLPRSHFGAHRVYTAHYVASRHIPPVRHFTEQRAAPIQPPRAVPRAAAAGYAGSNSNSYAVPRGDAGTPANARGSRAVNRPAALPPPTFKQPLTEPANAPRARVRGDSQTDLSRRPDPVEPSAAPAGTATPRRTWRNDRSSQPAHTPGAQVGTQERASSGPAPGSRPNNAAADGSLEPPTPAPAAAPRDSFFNRGRSDGAPRERESAPPQGSRASPRNAPARESAPPPQAAPARESAPPPQAAPASGGDSRSNRSAPRSEGRSGGNGGGAPAGARNSNRSR